MIFLRKNKIIILSVFIVIIFILHLFLLPISPLPWFDEVFFTSVTNSFLTRGDFYLDVSPLFNDKEVLTYGPVYFVLTSIPIKIFGWGIFQFRIVNFLFSIGSVIIAAKILKNYNINNFKVLLFVVIYILDTMFSINSHSGRMDGVAVFFVLCTIFILLKENIRYKDYFIAGLFSILAALTTPRSLFFLVPILLISFIPFIFKIRENKNLLKILFFSITPIIIITFWILIKFGSISNLFDFYFVGDNPNFGNKSTVSSFLAFKPYVKKFEYHILITSIVLTISTLIYKKFKVNKIIWISASNILLFYLFILDTGMYSIFIIPFIYLLIFISLDNLKVKPLISNIIIISIFILNLSVFMIKNSSVIYDFKYRQTNYVDTSIKYSIPPNSKIIGNDIYFYSALKNKCIFQTIDRGLSINERIDYHLNNFDFEYLIINTSNNENSNLGKKYLNAGVFELVSTIKPVADNRILTITMSKMLGSPTPYYSYEGIIYKRIK